MLEDEFDDLVIDWSSWRIGLDIGGFEAWVFVHYQDGWTYDVNIVGEYDAEANQDGTYSRLMAPADNLLDAFTRGFKCLEEGTRRLRGRRVPSVPSRGWLGSDSLNTKEKRDWEESHF